ncbi:hypothetical protein D1627_13980 [Pontibacter oryzae]|uniref:DUF554 family protein n=1 Tax=Pontibacter oryzae TaxID=2304593 RepID=A0A399S5T6_9BACT|nr:hypothetical protein D1627_13980 [Pontibacter oryzae]
MLTLPVFFVSVLAGVGVTQTLNNAQVVIAVSSAMSAGLMFLVNSLYFDIKRLKTSLVITAILGLIVPIIVQAIEL